MKMLFVLLISFHIYAGNEAMFGLNFGQTTKEIRAMGVTLIFKDSLNNLFSYKCKTLPKNFSSAESYTLIFSDDSLVKIIMLGNTIDNDLYGNDGKEAFKNTMELLKKKYTVGDVSDFSGLVLYKEPYEFYECLRYEGCGFYAAALKGDNKTVCLELKGLERGKGYLVLVIESVQEFSRALEKSKQMTIKTDLDALN
jgi:hypothetical protein